MVILRLLLCFATLLEARSLRLFSTAELINVTHGDGLSSSGQGPSSAAALPDVTPSKGIFASDERGEGSNIPSNLATDFDPIPNPRVAILLVGNNLVSRAPPLKQSTRTLINKTAIPVSAGAKAERTRKLVEAIMKNISRWKKHASSGAGGVKDLKAMRERGVQEDESRLSNNLPWYVPPDFQQGVQSYQNSEFSLNVSDDELKKLAEVDYWPWGSFLHYVYKVLDTSLGKKPEVFLCTKNLTGPMPPEITESFDIKAEDQFTRGARCYQEVVNDAKFGKYDYYIKIRPDFVFTGAFPNVSTLHPERFHSRFREALGLKNLNSAHFSWEGCDENCNGFPWSSYGYVNDDMVFVAPAAVADKVFVNSSEVLRLQETFVWPKEWLHTIRHNWETLFAKSIAAQAVLSDPLEVMGYPVEAKVNHRAMQHMCLFQKMKKEKCGHYRPLIRAHRDLLAAVRDMNGPRTLRPMKTRPRQLPHGWLDALKKLNMTPDQGLIEAPKVAGAAAGRREAEEIAETTKGEAAAEAARP